MTALKITFLQTGGTIDKDYPRSTKGWAFEIADPAVTRILEKLNPNFEFEIKTVLKKDSLEITTTDRTRLLDICQNIQNDKIIITHGTDTMIETGQFLSTLTDKTIILTGSMRPERFANSDAPITLGTAIGAINVVKNGVYIAMHGLILPIQTATRNFETGQFYAIN